MCSRWKYPELFTEVQWMWHLFWGPSRENVSSVCIGTGKLKPAFSMAHQQHINLSAHISHLLLINILWTERVRRNHRWHSITSGLVSTLVGVERHKYFRVEVTLGFNSHFCVLYYKTCLFLLRLNAKMPPQPNLHCPVNLSKQEMHCCLWLLFKMLFNRSVCRGSLWHRAFKRWKASTQIH